MGRNIQLEDRITKFAARCVAEAGYVGKTSLAALIAESEELTRIMSASVITARKGLD